MTIEHLQVALSLKIPFFIAITKIDICPDHIKKNTINNIKNYLTENNIKNNIPIIPISNKTGFNIAKLKNLIFKLKSNIKYSISNRSLFSVESRYFVDGVGIILAGKLLSGELFKNDKVLFGPFNNKFIKVTIKSFHNNFKEPIENLSAGQSGCIAIKSNK